MVRSFLELNINVCFSWCYIYLGTNSTYIELKRIASPFLDTISNLKPTEIFFLRLDFSYKTSSNVTECVSGYTSTQVHWLDVNIKEKNKKQARFIGFHWDTSAKMNKVLRSKKDVSTSCTQKFLPKTFD